MGMMIYVPPTPSRDWVTEAGGSRGCVLIPFEPQAQEYPAIYGLRVAVPTFADPGIQQDALWGLPQVWGYRPGEDPHADRWFDGRAAENQNHFFDKRLDGKNFQNPADAPDDYRLPSAPLGDGPGDAGYEGRGFFCTFLVDQPGIHYMAVCSDRSVYYTETQNALHAASESFPPMIVHLALVGPEPVPEEAAFLVSQKEPHWRQLDAHMWPLRESDRWQYPPDSRYQLFEYFSNQHEFYVEEDVVEATRQALEGLTG